MCSRHMTATAMQSTLQGVAGDSVCCLSVQCRVVALRVRTRAKQGMLWELRVLSVGAHTARVASYHLMHCIG